MIRTALNKRVDRKPNDPPPARPMILNLLFRLPLDLTHVALPLREKPLALSKKWRRLSRFDIASLSSASRLLDALNQLGGGAVLQVRQDTHHPPSSSTRDASGSRSRV
jgi:hypothetical protein